MTDVLTERHFDTRDDASIAAANHIERCIKRELAESPRATIALSGGTTPARCFDVLSQKKLDWPRVQLAMSDERWVPSDHPDSNEKLLRETLRTNEAANAGVLPIYQGDLTVDERCDALQKLFPSNGTACSLLGMGTDGHFASLFPDADNLALGLDSSAARFYIPVRTAASPHPRVSMTLAALSRSRELILLFFGDEKRSIFESAKATESRLPIAALLQLDDVPLTVYWAP